MAFYFSFSCGITHSTNPTRQTSRHAELALLFAAQLKLTFFETIPPERTERRSALVRLKARPTEPPPRPASPPGQQPIVHWLHPRTTVRGAITVGFEICVGTLRLRCQHTDGVERWSVKVLWRRWTMMAISFFRSFIAIPAHLIARKRKCWCVSCYHNASWKNWNSSRLSTECGLFATPKNPRFYSF